MTNSVERTDGLKQKLDQISATIGDESAIASKQDDMAKEIEALQQPSHSAGK